MAVENVISIYRLLTPLFQSPSSEFYLAEDTSGATPLAIITLWPTVTLTESVDQQEFLQKAQGGTIRCQSKIIAIRDAGIQDLHPYIVTPSSYEIRELLERQVKALDQILQKMQKNFPNDQRVLLNTLLYAFITPSSSNEQNIVVKQETPAPIVSNPLVAPIQETPLPLEDKTFISPIQEFLVPTDPSITVEPTLLSKKSDPQELVNPAPTTTPEPTALSNNSTSQMLTGAVGWARDKLVSQKKLPSISFPAWKTLPGGRKLSTWQVVVAATLLLLLLAWGINTLHIRLLATNATITMKPMSKEIRQTYTISVDSQNNSGPLTVKGRALSTTSQQLVQTVATTGHGHHDATRASGMIVISQINLTNSTGNDVLNISIGDNNGVTVTGDNTAHIYTGATVSIPAHATPAGTAGNIAAHDMDGPIQIVDHYTQARIGTAYISNPQPFSGGMDARDYTYVQQSDIDKVAAALMTQLTPDTIALVKKQVKQGELLVKDPSCSQNVSSDQKAQDEAFNVTVKVNLTCSALSYPDHALQDAALKVYTKDGSTQLGTGYSVVGATVLSKPVIVSSGVNAFTITADGIWSFQYTDQSQQALKKSIAGKPLDDALAVLHTRKDIQSVSIVTNGGFGTAVPAISARIKLVIGQVNGLHA